MMIPIEKVGKTNRTWYVLYMAVKVEIFIIKYLIIFSSRQKLNFKHLNYNIRFYIHIKNILKCRHYTP